MIVQNLKVLNSSDDYFSEELENFHMFSICLVRESLIVDVSLGQ